MKRFLDLSLCGVGLIVAAPLMVVIAAAVYATMGAPVLFRQPRVGRDESIFVLLKFRTMRGVAVPGREALDDEQRLTPFGRFLRRMSLDELPQLWNVLTGDMSIVGPRPLLVDYLPLYTPQQRVRHTVRPGMTGWAQLHGRNAAEWEDRLALDAWYATNRNLWLDFRIIWRTVLHLLHVHSNRADHHRTMPRFTGTTKSQN